MFKFPPLEKEQVMLCRFRLSTNTILNNDYTDYGGVGETYYLIFDDQNSANQYVDKEGRTGYVYKTYGKRGEIVSQINPWNNSPAIKILDELLARRDEKVVFENDNFRVDESTDEGFLHLIYRKPNSAPFEIQLSDNRLDVQTDKNMPNSFFTDDDASMSAFKALVEGLL